MKICVISSTVFPLEGEQGLLGYGGLEVVAYHTAKGLAERGHKVTLIAPIGSSCPGCEVIECLPPRYAEEAAYGGAVWRDANGQEHRWQGYWSKLLEFNNGGVIVDHSWETWAAALKIEGRLTAPILKTCHAPVNTMFSQPPHPCVSCVCISEDQKNHFEALYSPREARVCYNGIDLDFYKSTQTKRTDRYLFLARFSSIKGAALALEACKNADAELDLVGDTTITGEPAYYQMCCEMADGKRRRIVGGIPRGETVWWYSQAKALLHPNKIFREPFGLAPVEAQACGLGVCAFNYGAMRETIVHGETGFLVNSVKEMETLIQNRAFDSIKEERCRESASRFTIQKMVERYEQLCIEAIESGGW